ncbi:Emp65p NDAI_0B03030 [Naumovozyma dairenensis CBS 421]|uniref:Uncharacterized protein n=1 Tax=Naumovozyma dairenensis (strain ATCC 10597 / BCRC 20456 / CBS 421 / NBRC 0211 / NRRL Y-12639) TaxID=1071378 RepID=G0W6C7_NAUDC|nr:hypothetical protein NDAI_0B03030 [Naumovozyma dairenensis CBS 421]CCD23338.1 hypothetical protein NDAI_0B03030 [Naumovozyma dairenensis CBS 421]
MVKKTRNRSASFKRKRQYDVGNRWRQLKGLGNRFIQAMDHQGLRSDKEIEMEGDSVDEVEIEQLLNMITMPIYLEKYMFFTLLACFDCFLYHFTGLPIKIIQNLSLTRKNKTITFPTGLNKHKQRKNWLTKTYKERCLVFLIGVSSMFLSKLNTSIIYHRIKRQSAMKLYMLFSVLEMADILLASMGQSLSAVVLSRIGYGRKIYQKGLLISLSVIYILLHGYVLVYQAVALNVAVNSYSNSLLTLLLSMQFAEIKSAVLKKFDKEGLFQITIADAVERFKLFLLLMIIILRNISANPIGLPTSWSFKKSSTVLMNFLSGPFISVIGSEIIVDWVKHAYINKFNRIRPEIYDKFFYITYNDHTTSLRKFQDRMGLPIPAFVVLFIVMVRPTLFQIFQQSNFPLITQSIIILIFSFWILVMMKFILHTILEKWGVQIQKSWEKVPVDTTVKESQYVPGMLSDGQGKVDELSRMVIHLDDKIDFKKSNHPTYLPERSTELPPSLNDKRIERNLKKPNGLEEVARYKMVSKNIW